MKLTDNIRRILSALLVFALFLSLAPMDAFAVGGDAVVVISGSDYQQKGTAPQSTTTSILNQIKKDYATADGFLFGGDYYQDTLDTTTKSKEGKNELDAAVTAAYPNLANRVYIQGNHDNDSLVSDGTLASTGAHDTDAYGVYAINEKDYPWGWQASSSFQSTCKNTANNLDAYLDAKADAGYTKPIFVITHVPLHYTPRTSSMGDGKYAKYLYDVLDEAGEKGLNIIFLFGHNHSNTYDDYIGGGQIYLAKGNSIAIANEGSTSSYFTDELTFTYMNCGYVGYVGGKAGTNLNMSVFEITEDEVIVKRYGTSGQVQLKAAGVTTSGAPAADTTVVESGATISIGTPVPAVTLTDNNVTVTSAGLTGLSVSKVFGTDSTDRYDAETYSAYASYDIAPEGYTQGKSATVTIQLDTADGFDASRAVLVIDQHSGTEKRVSIENGAVTFSTNHFSTYDIAQRDPSAGYNYELVTSVKAGEAYVIVGNNHAVALMDNDGSLGSQEVTISGTTLISETELTQWTFSSATSGTITSSDGRKLGYSSSSWNLTGSGDCSFDIGTGSDSFSLRVIRSSSGYNRYYFNYDGSSWTSKPTSTAYVRLYQLSENGSGTTEPTEPIEPSEPTEPTVPDVDSDWTELTSGNTYVLDTDGIDSGAKYLVVAESYAKALTAASSNNNASDVAISGNNATADSDYGWTFTASGSGYQIHKNGTYLGRSNSNIATGSASTVWTVSSQGSGKYNVTQSGGYSWWGGSSSYYVRWSNSNGYFQASSSNQNPVRLYKYTGSGIGASYIRLTGEQQQDYVIADAADLNTVLGKIKIQTSNDGKTVSGEIAVTSSMVTWNKSFNGAEAGTYTGTVSYENNTLGTITVTVIAAHNFETVTVEATCTEDGSITTKCTICGEETVEVIKATGHDYECVETAATCSKDGSKVYTCANCADTYTEVIPATGEHNYETVTVDATCAKDGSVTTTCSICGDTGTEIIPATGDHAYETVTVEATCVANGSATYTCGICGKNYVEIIPATGKHIYEAVTVNATCTEDGSVSHTCAYCGDSYVEVIPAAGHNYTCAVTEATCTEAGSKVYTCTVCGNTYTEEIAAIGHDYKAVITAPTCTEEGFSTYTCTHCGHSYVADKTAALGHIYETATVAATCTADGSVTYYCACGDTYSEVIPSTGHNYQAVVTVPTCTAAGYTTYTCVACGDSYVADETAALGHSNSTVVVAPTCTTGGYTTDTCSVCGEYRMYDETAALGHNYVSVTVDPTETEGGYTTHTCSTCGHSYTDNYVDALGHTIVSVVTDPTCTAEGYTTHTCTVCGEVTVDTYVPALGHDYQTVTVDATCTADGSITKTCAHCGDTSTEVIGAYGHDYIATVTVPTCTEGGHTVYSCNRCGDNYVADQTEATGHNYTTITVDVTCTEDGYTTYLCTNCGDSYVGDTAAALGHNYETVTADATCTEDGSITHICSRCGDSYAEVIPATGHNYESVVTDPTCTENGFTTYSCSCGESYMADEVPATGHNYSCVEENGNQIYTCDSCGDTYTVTIGWVNLSGTYVLDTDGLDTGVSNKYLIVSAETNQAMTLSGTTVGNAPVQINGNTIALDDASRYEFYFQPYGDKLLLTQDGSRTVYHSNAVMYYGNNSAGHWAVTNRGNGSYQVLNRDGNGNWSLNYGYIWGNDSVSRFGVSYNERHVRLFKAADSYARLYGTLNQTWAHGADVTESAVLSKVQIQTSANGVTADATAAVETGMVTWDKAFDGYTAGTYTATVNYKGAELGTITVVVTGEHTYEDVVAEATCTEAGYTTHTCTVCGHSYTDGNTAALGHSYTVKEENNQRIYTCERCGHSYSENLALTYTKVSSISGENNYVITFVSGSKYYAMSHKNNQISAVQVTVSNNQITSEITDDLVWTYDDGKLSYQSGSTTCYLYAQPASGWWGWWSTPTLTVSSTNSTDVSFSNSKLKMGNYYLRYSSSKISLNSKSSTTNFFIEE